MKEIDCRGLACPAPVIMTKKAIEDSSGDSCRVILDNGAARENVLRFCRSKGLAVSEEEGSYGTTLTINCPVQSLPFEKSATTTLAPIILIASDCLGSGSDELGRLLMKNFIITLLELQDQPEKILFVNSGVLLTTEGSELLEPLHRLSAAGVEILSCGVCLDYYCKREKLSVGLVTNMYTIAESLLSAGNSIRL